jgi:hypothetical protein
MPLEFQEVEAPRCLENRHMKVVSCQTYTPAVFTPRKYYWYSFLLESDSTPVPWCDRRIMSMKNSNDTIGNWTRNLPACGGGGGNSLLKECSWCHPSLFFIFFGHLHFVKLYKYMYKSLYKYMYKLLYRPPYTTSYGSILRDWTWRQVGVQGGGGFYKNQTTISDKKWREIRSSQLLTIDLFSHFLPTLDPQIHASSFHIIWIPDCCK